MSLVPEVTRARVLAEAISRGDSKPKYPVQNVMVRMPINMLATLDAMRERASKSRSAMCVHLIEVALAEVSKHIDPEDLFEIQSEADDILSSWLEDIAQEANEKTNEGDEPC